MTWSSIDCASHCLADEERTDAIIAVLSEICEGAVVLDIGAGSGILALGAQRSGAARVIAVEKDLYVCDLLRWAMADQGASIEIICGDAADVALPRADVIVAELVDVWLLEEDLTSVLRGLFLRGIIDERTHLIPAGYTFDLDFGTCDWSNSYGGLRWPYYEWPFYSSPGWRIPTFKALIECPAIASINLMDIAASGRLDLGMQIAVEPDAAQGLAEANAVRIRGTLHLSNQRSIGRSGAMNAPLVFPIRPRGTGEAWSAGLSVSLKLSGGLKSLRLNAGPVSLLPWSHEP